MSLEHPVLDGIYVLKLVDEQVSGPHTAVFCAQLGVGLQGVDRHGHQVVQVYDVLPELFLVVEFEQLVPFGVPGRGVLFQPPGFVVSLPLQEVLYFVGRHLLDGRLSAVVPVPVFDVHGVQHVADGGLGLVMVPHGVLGGAAQRGGAHRPEESGGVGMEGSNVELPGDFGVFGGLGHLLSGHLGGPAVQGEVGDGGGVGSRAYQGEDPADQGLGFPGAGAADDYDRSGRRLGCGPLHGVQGHL